MTRSSTLRAANEMISPAVVEGCSRHSVAVEARRSSSFGLSPNRHWRDRLANGGAALTRAARLSFGLLLLRCLALECTARTDMFYLSKPQMNKEMKSSAKREE